MRHAAVAIRRPNIVVLPFIFCAVTLAVFDRDPQHLIAGMAIDEPEKGRQQFALVLGRRGANLGDDRFGIAALELDRARVVLVLPPGAVLRLAPDPDIGSTPILANGGLLGDEHAIEPRAFARNNLDELHDSPQGCLCRSEHITVRPLELATEMAPK